MEGSWHSREADEVLGELHSDAAAGLSAEEAAARLEQYGKNELTREKKASPILLFLNQFKNILSIILMVAVALSVLVGETVDAAIIAVIVLFCGVLGFVQEYRAERALDALKKMLAPTITVLRSGREEEVPASDLVPGDVLVLEAGDRIPADARVVEQASLRCDEAPLTGESAPVGKNTQALPPETPVGGRKNMVFTGTTVTYGRGRAVVTATGMSTEFGAIARAVSFVKTEPTPLELRTAEIGKWMGIISLAICVLVAGVGVLREAMIHTIELPFLVKMIMFAVALAVAAVPEALAAIVTGALAIGMHQMAKQHALVRKMPAVETLGCTTVICTDKTGTLTKGQMTVRGIFAGLEALEVTGSGYDPAGEFKAAGNAAATDAAPLSALLLAGLLCNDSSLEQVEGQWAIKGDPTEGALVVAAAKAGLDVPDLRQKNPRIEEIPFSSERKRMTTAHSMEDGSRAAFMKGAPERVLEECTQILDEGGVRDLTDQDRARILAAGEEMAGQALRILGLARRDLAEGFSDFTEESLEKDFVFLGLSGMMDPPREEAAEAIRVCKHVHIKPVMITGDHKLTAMAVAREIGIFHEGDRVLTGEELEKMPDEEFEAIVNQVTVYARVSPMDKLKIVKAWKKRGEVVAMTGDGVNDAPALKHADIGVAMGLSGTDVAREAADMVLTDDNFATIVKAIELGRWIYDNIKKYLTYLMRCNITEVAVLGGVVLVSGPEYLPLLPAAILYMNLATDGLPALALGVAPPEPDIMEKPPRDPRESVFSTEVKTFIALALLIEIPFFYWLFYHDLHDIAHARTEVFFLFVFVELVIALNFRSMRFSILKAPPHKWLILALAWEVVMVVVLIQFPSVREAFGILKPTLADLKIILILSAVVFASMEALKFFLRKQAERAAR